MGLAIVAALLSLVLTIVLMPHFIRFIKIKKISGQQMHEDVKQHLEKAGTPTMGGGVFLAVAISVSGVFSLILKAQGSDVSAAWGILVVLLIYGAIGFLDDFLKIFKKINEGLTSRQKMAAQIIGGIVFYLLYVQPSGLESLNVFGYELKLGIVYIVFALFWIVGFSNAVNLTDGIDGLASISVAISLVAYTIIAFVQKQFDIVLISLSMIGALLGFFVFNKKPAKVFMGDVGSLALGAMLATISIALHQEWTLLFIGIVYVLETSSVMLQVTYFKYTKKKFGEGRRIFKMTPFHHHLELGGLTGKDYEWSEWQVDAFLWSIGGIASIIVLCALYL